MAGEPRLISAASTRLVKYLSPPVLVGAVVWLVDAIDWVHRYRSISPFMNAFALLFIGTTLWMAWTSAGLKAVALSSDVLYVSNYRREITVPLRDIVRITQRGHWAVFVHLEHETEFGRRIAFLPWILLRRASSPVVQELRDAVQAAKRADPAAHLD